MYDAFTAIYLFQTCNSDGCDCDEKTLSSDAIDDARGCASPGRFLVMASFTFRGKSYTLTTRQERIKVYGPWGAEGRKTFVRGYTQLPDRSEHDESAEHMCQRIVDDAARTEVCSIVSIVCPAPWH